MSDSENAKRYLKLRDWMTANVEDSWKEVCNYASIGVYIGWDAADEYLDNLPECNFGLSEEKHE